MSCNSIDVRVQPDPNPRPAPKPAKAFRAPDDPERAKTIPIRPPTTKPTVVLMTIDSIPSLIVDETASSDGGDDLVGLDIFYQEILFHGF